MIALAPIGYVHGGRTEPLDDHWDDIEAEIRLDPERFGPEALAGLDAFSHIEVIFQFHRVAESRIVSDARHPRGRADWPKAGIFAQRAKARPNRLGVTACALRFVAGLTVGVRGLDAIDGTPVLDLKPYMTGFAPRSAVREPDWAREIMKEYW